MLKVTRQQLSHNQNQQLTKILQRSVIPLNNLKKKCSIWKIVILSSQCSIFGFLDSHLPENGAMRPVQSAIKQPKNIINVQTVITVCKTQT